MVSIFLDASCLQRWQFCNSIFEDMFYIKPIVVALYSSPVGMVHYTDIYGCGICSVENYILKWTENFKVCKVVKFET